MTPVPSDIVEVHDLFEHAIQEEAFVVLAASTATESLLVVFSVSKDWNQPMVERCRLAPCEIPVKVVSAFGLLLCGTSRHVSAETQRTANLRIHW